MKKSLIALAFGTLGLGIAEFTMMGILPYVATDLGISILLLSPHPWCSAILMTLCTAGLFAVSSPEQVLMIRVAPGGEMLGGACVQMAFNLGNAIGAYIGGLALSGGYRYPALAGVPFALMGFILFLVFYKKFQAKY